jgi:hypothetical protein
MYNIQVKWPNGKKFEDKFVETLLKYGFKDEYMSEEWLKHPIFIQSFAPTSLIYISNMTKSPKVLLIDDTTVRTQDTNQVLTVIFHLFCYIAIHQLFLRIIIYVLVFLLLYFSKGFFVYSSPPVHVYIYEPLALR